MRIATETVILTAERKKTESRAVLSMLTDAEIISRARGLLDMEHLISTLKKQYHAKEQRGMNPEELAKLRKNVEMNEAILARSLEYMYKCKKTFEEYQAIGDGYGKP